MAARFPTVIAAFVAVVTSCSIARAQDYESPSLQRSALRLARAAITRYLANRSILPVPADTPAALRRRSGVFVTIEKQGRIAPRGCRGTLQPRHASLAAEIIHNAIAACSRDAHQPPLKLNELPQCLISLTIIQHVRPIDSISQHDAAHNGLIAEQGSHIGIVLPYEGHDAITQLKWARRKAGLDDSASVTLKELIGIRFRE